MLKRVDKLLIGKDINRTVATLGGSSDDLADGEIVVLDKNMSLLAAGATISDTDIIYIIQGTGDTYDYSDADGTAVTDVRRFIVSDPIEGRLVKSWKGLSYDAKSEQISSFTDTAFTPVIGTEYVVRVVYKDINEHPGQFTQTFRYVSTTTVLATFNTAFAAAINAHSGRRVQATEDATHLILTGRVITDCTSSLTDIDKFSQVRFEAFYYYVHGTTGAWTEWNATTLAQTVTPADHGSGTWEQVRDLEKATKAHSGFTNRTKFPVKEPTTFAVKDATYDLLAIESSKSYESSDAWQKQAPLTTLVAIPVPSTGTQMTDVLAVLNPWFASCPGAFDTVAV